MLPKNYPLFLDRETRTLHVVGLENDYGSDVWSLLPDYIAENMDELNMTIEANRREEKREFSGFQRIHY
ncbi:MAG: hypothetical protein NC131_16990 [Roseburia sp.]|nr:hypothetical protein [Roseburia sp.]